MNDGCVVVFTSRPTIRILDEGGSKSWVLDPRRARTINFVVCTWNPSGEYAVVTPDRARGEAFLIGKISAISEDPDQPGRHIIRFFEFAEIGVPNVWPKGRRNPVTYTTLSELGIVASSLDFQVATNKVELQTSRNHPPQPVVMGPQSDITPMSIETAKRGLAATFQVDPGSIEIVIRG